MLQQVGACFGHDDRNPFRLVLVEPDLFRHRASDSTSLRRLTAFFDDDSNGPGHLYRHLKIEILVPSPTFE